jgi:hypothetical protein
MKPALQILLDMVKESVEASPQEIHRAFKGRRRPPLTVIAARLRDLREAGLLDVRRRSEAASDPNEYNLYRISNRNDHDHLWVPASEFGRAQYRCSVEGCVVRASRRSNGEIVQLKTLKQPVKLGQQYARSYGYAPDDIGSRPSRGRRE